MSSAWPTRAFRRYSVDFQIPDTYPHLMAKFDAGQVLDAIARTGHVQSFMQYANSHAGMCFFQTRHGKPHANMGRRDFLREMVAACRARGIAPLAYFSVTYDNWGYAEHPDWRCVWDHGSADILRGRYGYCCPNAPGYRQYVTASVTQLVTDYDLAGLFFDMTFWAGVCYCPHCVARFRAEQGDDPPRTADWKDPLWRAFVSAREDWIVEFGRLLTATAKRHKAGIIVSHQFSSVWGILGRGVPSRFASCSDYASGDFYGDYTMHSLACKMYDSLSTTKPFEHASCFTHSYLLHSAYKSREMIELESLVAPLHSGAFLMLHAAEPDGSMNLKAYAMAAGIASSKAGLERFFGGDAAADLALYFDDQSVFNFDASPCPAHQAAWDDSAPHKKGIAGLARVLIQAHIPWGVVTNHTLDQLHAYKAVVLCNAWGLTAERAAVLREFVRDGGVLIATGQSSLDKLGATPRFHLEDVLGVAWERVTGRWSAFITPTDDALSRAVFPHEHLEFIGPFQRVRPVADVQVLAVITHPHVDPYEGNPLNHRMTAVHSNPPSPEVGTEPAITVHRYGKGTAVYVASIVETQAQEPGFHNLFAHLVQRVVPERTFEAEAHPSVEVTLRHQPEHQRLLVGLLNTQTQFPQIPVPACVTLCLPEGCTPVAAVCLPEETPVDFTTRPHGVVVTVPPFTKLAMVMVRYIRQGEA